MLTVLKIKNLALVEDLTWELGAGLVGVTGETGAGKSIIVGALKLVLGERADRGLIRTGEDTCTIDAVFDLVKPEAVNAVLADAGLDACEENQLLIRRVTTNSGNRQFINGSPTTLAVLKSLGQYLVDLHGPHDHQSLLSQDRQLDMLDAYAHADSESIAYRRAYRAWKTLVAEHAELRDSERVNEQELDLLRHQINEIDEADLKPGDATELERRYKTASNSSRLLDLARRILGSLGDADDSVLSRLGEIVRNVRELEKTDPAVTDLTQGIDGAQVELQELGSSLRDYVGQLELDPAEIAALENRINLVESLKRKYGHSIEDILAFKEDAEHRLGRIEGRGDELERLETEIRAARETVEAAGMELSQKRRGAAPRLSKEIASHLGALGFKRSKFEVFVERREEPGPSGTEEIDFIFGPNPGEPGKPLRLIASSGEMSRVMLAVKSALARQDAIPLLVFDEIDANVGGEIAQAVGARMADLGKSHQVIAITHLPQVAALASCHYVVKKEFGDDDRTRSILREVKGKSRVAEIARMLGGKASSAKAHAESLMATV